jgi:hypothetical protein
MNMRFKKCRTVFTNFLRTVLYQKNKAVFYDTPVEIVWVDAVTSTTGNAGNPVFINSLWKYFLVSLLK